MFALILYATVGVILLLLFIAVVYISIKEKDASLFPWCLLVPIMGILMIAASFNYADRTGTVCEVAKVQNGYVKAIVNGEIELVPSYSYQILFLDEDSEYRTFTTTDIHYAVLKEGDSITYTKADTDRVKED